VPLYDYDCAACGRRFEVIHGVNDAAPEHCPLCGEGPVRKAFTAPAVHFKGSGWAKKERRAAAKNRSSSSEDGDKSDKGEKGDKGEAGDKAGESSKTAEAGSSSKGAGASSSTSSGATRPAADTGRSSD
jgi:putative FmdB family regulatory protein